MSSEGKSRLTRWAQRKTAVKRRGGAAAPMNPEQSADVPATPAEPPEDAQSELQKSGRAEGEPDLPDIDSLTATSDFTAFMKDGVPASLRRLALRRLWASDPMFNVIDEMVEYGEDYTDGAMVVEGMKSAWEAGRGYAKKTMGADGEEQLVPDDPTEQECVKDQRDAPNVAPPEDDSKETG